MQAQHVAPFDRDPVGVQYGPELVVADQPVAVPVVVPKVEQDAAALDRLGSKVRAGLQQAIAARALPMVVTGTASLFRIHLKPQPPRSYREAWPTPLERGLLARMSQFMLGQGVILPAFSSSSLSTVMTEADIDFFLAAFAEFLDALMDRGGVRELPASRAAPG